MSFFHSNAARNAQRWFNIVLTLFLAAFTIEQIFAPPSWWLDLRKIYISDVEAGAGSPIVSVDQSIYRKFLMHWDIQVRRIGASATPLDNDSKPPKPDLSNFTPFCHADGETFQYPGRKLAPILTLQDLMNGRQCPAFTPGAYYVEFLAQWPDVVAWRSVVYDTPVFHVDEPPPPPPPPPPPKIVIERPTTVIQQSVTKSVTRTIVQGARCEPSLIPPRFCPPGRSGGGHRRHGGR